MPNSSSSANSSSIKSTGSAPRSFAKLVAIVIRRRAELREHNLLYSIKGLFLFHPHQPFRQATTLTPLGSRAVGHSVSRLAHRPGIRTSSCASHQALPQARRSVVLPLVRFSSKPCRLSLTSRAKSCASVSQDQVTQTQPPYTT